MIYFPVKSPRALNIRINKVKMKLWISSESQEYVCIWLGAACPSAFRNKNHTEPEKDLITVSQTH